MGNRDAGEVPGFRGPDGPQLAPELDAGLDRLSRRSLLKGLLAVSASGLFDIRHSLAETFRPGAVAPPEVSPFDLDFRTVEQFRPVELLPRRFTQVAELFGDAEPAAFVLNPMHADGRPAEASRTGAALRIASYEDARTVYQSDAAPAAPFATAILEIEALQTGSDQAAVAVGLLRDSRNYLVAGFSPGRSPGSGSVTVDLAIEGRIRQLASAEVEMAAASQIAFVLNENVVTALTGDAAGWVPITQFAVGELIDFRDPDLLASFRYGFGVGGAGRSMELRAFRAGHFGLVGIRDPHVVSHADGTPFIRDNKLYFSATHAGLGFFQAAHFGVWTLDLGDLGKIENVAKLFFARDGLVLGDHAGHIVVDEQETGFHIAVSGWGDFDYDGVKVHYVQTMRNVLEGVHVLESAPMALPTEVSSWDPSLVRIDDRWHVAFVESAYQDRQRGFDFRPALARTAAGGSLGELTRVGADLTRGETEGVILQKIGGKWYLLASDGDDRKYRVYDLAMNHLGFLKAPYGSNIPHPQVVPVTKGGLTSYLLLTFDGTPFSPQSSYGTHGDFIVMRAAQTVPGAEFAPR